MLGDKRGRVRSSASWRKKKGGANTHDWMIETLEDPISLHTLSSFRLAFFFGMAFSATSRVTSPGAVWTEGFRMAAKKTGEAGRELGNLGVAVGERHGWAGCAALSEGSAFWWYLLCRALLYAMTVMWGL